MSSKSITSSAKSKESQNENIEKREISFPINPSTNKISTTDVSKRVWVAVLSALTNSTKAENTSDEDYLQRAKNLIRKIECMHNSQWRHGYIPILAEIAEIQASTTPNECVDMARCGCDALHRIMQYGNVSIREAVFSNSESDKAVIGESLNFHYFETVSFHGSKSAGNIAARKQFQLAEVLDINNPSNVTFLANEGMKAKLNRWSTYGCMEPSAGVSASKIADEKDATSLVSSKVFVLLGATSELGPMESLLDLGATIAGVARPGIKLQKLIQRFTSKSDAGTLHLPLKKISAAPSANVKHEVDAATDDKKIASFSLKVGADLITDVREIAQWIVSLEPEKQLVLCNLAYLDGANNVRASVSMDIITEYVCEKRKNTALSFLISPATSHIIPEDAADNSKERLVNFSKCKSPLALMKFPGFNYQPNKISGLLSRTNLRVINGLSDLQGPNYALSKCMQQWRAIIARAEGHIVSANHAPASRTANMINHKSIANALEGMQSFPPLLTFEPRTTSTLMASLMLYDLNFDCSSANPATDISHPMCLFNENSVHGGLWRCPFSLDSIQVSSYFTGMFNNGIFGSRFSLEGHDMQ